MNESIVDLTLCFRFDSLFVLSISLQIETDGSEIDLNLRSIDAFVKCLSPYD